MTIGTVNLNLQFALPGNWAPEQVESVLNEQLAIVFGQGNVDSILTIVEASIDPQTLQSVVDPLRAARTVAKVLQFNPQVPSPQVQAVQQAPPTITFPRPQGG